MEMVRYLVVLFLLVAGSPASAEDLKIWDEDGPPTTKERPADTPESKADTKEPTTAKATAEDEEEGRLQHSLLYANYLHGFAGTGTNRALIFDLEAQVAAQGFGLGVQSPLTDFFLLGARLSYFGLDFGQVASTTVVMMSLLPALRLTLGENFDLVTQFGVGSDFSNFALHAEGGLFMYVSDHGALFLNIAYLSHTIDTVSGNPWEYSMTSLHVGFAIGQ